MEHLAQLPVLFYAKGAGDQVRYGQGLGGFVSAELWAAERPLAINHFIKLQLGLLDSFTA